MYIYNKHHVFVLTFWGRGIYIKNIKKCRLTFYEKLGKNGRQTGRIIGRYFIKWVNYNQ